MSKMTLPFREAVKRENQGGETLAHILCNQQSYHILRILYVNCQVNVMLKSNHLVT